MRKDRPILFSPPMMRAILSGEKSQTRRLASSPLAASLPGDRLYTREAFRVAQCFDRVAPSHLCDKVIVAYAADEDRRHPHARLRPAIHMPRWMSRATLTLSEIKFEPLQDITPEDALAEGVMEFRRSCPDLTAFTQDPVELFSILWDLLHAGKSGEAWDDNPDIVAPVFFTERRNIDDFRNLTGGETS